MSTWLKLVPAWGWAALCGLVLAAVIGLGQQIRVNNLQGYLTAELERAARARDVQQQAEGEAQQADQEALAVMQERTPAGVDACTAASQAFDDELKRERGL